MEDNAKPNRRQLPRVADENEAAERHPDAVSGEDEAAHEAALGRIFDAVDQLADLSATGIVGIAVKAYVCILRAHGGTLEDPAAMRDYEPDPLERSTLEDVLRILPEAPQLVSMSPEPSIFGAR
jgi:hypothetical protein